MRVPTDRVRRPDARVREGVLRGVVEDGGVVAFRGAPYAAPPVGRRRFRPPEPAPRWTDVRDAAAFAPAPIQPPPPPGLSSRAYLGADTSEDCLYLNIWRPEAPGPHPVFVWIHGGGNIAGSASQITDGAAFARSGIVCVTVGYRLGVFGFLELGGAYSGSGVNALRDQIAALRWVRDNIEAFGGDPDRVTIGGVSAGGKNVVSLMASPLADGLFSAAIVESGGALVHDPAGAEHVADLLGGDPKTLAAMPAEALNALQIRLIADYGRPWPFRAVTGTDVLPEPPLDALRTRPRRLLIGTNRDESIVFLDRRSAEAPVTQRDLANVDVAAALPIADAYDRLFPKLSALERRVRFVSAEEYLVPSVRVAQAVSAPVYMYRFEQEAMSGPFAGFAAHGGEIPYVWKAFDDPLVRMLLGEVSAEARRLGDEIHARWCAFIRGKTPDVGAAAAWPLFDGRRLLVFGENASRPGQVDQAELALWEGWPA